MRLATYLGLVLRRIWARRLMLLGSFLGSTLVIALLVVLPLFEASVSAVDLLYTFRQAPDAVVNLTAVQSTIEYTPELGQAGREAVDEATAPLAQWYTEAEEWTLTREFVVIPTGFPDWLGLAEEWREAGADPDDIRWPQPPPEATQTRIFSSPDLVDRIVLVEGELVGDQNPAVSAAPTLRVVFGERLAFLSGLGVGDQIFLRPFVSPVDRFELVEISGIANPVDEMAAVWEGRDPDTLIYLSPQSLDQWAGSFSMVDPAQDPWLRTERGFGRLAVAQNFILHLDRDAVTLENVGGLASGVGGFASSVAAAEGIRTLTQLPGLVEEFDVRSVVFGAPILAMLALVVAGALYFLIYMAALALERESTEISLLRMRGATPWQTVGIHLMQSVIITVGAVAAAPFVARTMVALAGRIPPMSTLTGGEPLAIAQSRSIIPFAVGGGLLTFMAMGLAIVPLARRSVLELRVLSTRPARKSVWQRYNIDIFLVVVAGMLLYELRERGIVDTGTEDLGLDPFSVGAPALFLFSGALVLLRLLPSILRLIGWVMTRFRGMSMALPGWHLGRNPIPYGRLALLVWLTTGFGAFALTYADTLEVSYDDRASYAAGADIRIMDDNAVHLDIPEGAQGTAVLRDVGSARLSSRQSELLAVDPEVFPGVISWRNDYGGGGPEELLGPDVLGGPTDWGVELPSGTTALRAEGIVVPDSWAVRAVDGPARPVRIMARVVDDRGMFRVFAMEAPFDDLEWRTIDLPLTGEAAYNGPFDDDGGALVLQSLWLESEPQSGGTSLGETQLLLTGISAVTDSGATSLDEAIYGEFESHQDFEFRQAEADLAAVRFFSEVPAGATEPSDDDIAASALAKEGDAILWTVPDRIRVLPVPHLARTPERLGFILDPEAASISGLGIGEETLFGVAAARIEGVVVGSVDLVPTMGDARYEGLMLTHRDGLRQWVSGEPSWSLTGTIARTLEPDEMWVAADDPNAALTSLLSQLEEEPDEVVTATGVATDFSSRPIQVGLVSILFIGTGAGVVLAIAGVTGYVVEAVRRRHREMGVLRALGFRRSGVAGTFALEQVVVLGLGAVIGIAAGIGLMRLMIPFLQLGEEGAELVPPALLQVPMGRLAIYLGVVAVLLMVSVLFITRSVSARKLSEVLREVEG